jgi:hypothetical protein
MPLNQLETETVAFRPVVQWLNQLSPPSSSFNMVRNILKNIEPSV